MSLKKFGTGDGRVNEVEPIDQDQALAKQAAVQQSEARPWTPQDAAELAAENEDADGSAR